MHVHDSGGGSKISKREGSMISHEANYKIPTYSGFRIGLPKF